MFVSARFLRSVIYQPTCQSAPTRHPLIRPIFAGRHHPLIILVQRSNLPALLGMRLRLGHHGNNGGDKKSSSPSAADKRSRGAAHNQGGKGGLSNHGNGKEISSAVKSEGGNGSGKGQNGGKKGDGEGEGYQTITPTTIQVYADPTLARTVRELSVVLQRVRNNLKNLKEDVEDCTFEVLRQDHRQKTLDKTVKETKTLSADSTELLKSQQNDLRVLEKNLVFFSKMTASHDNQLRDSILRLNECDRRLEVALCKLDYVGSSLDRIKRLVGDDIRAELRDLRLAIQLAKSETRNIREALIRQGIIVPAPPSDEDGPVKQK